MKVAITFDLRNPKQWRRPWRDLWQDNMRLATEAEDLGFDRLWMQEHFFTDDGYAPSMPVFLTLIAERTTTIRFGSYIYILPLHHPVQVAQETAVLDHISGGRLDVGVGLGHRLVEYTAYGFSRKERRARLEENIELLKLAWTQSPFSFSGQFYALDDIEVEPRPLQQPHPPLWVAATAVPSAARAGRVGAHLACASSEPEVYDAYLDALRERGEDPSKFSISGGFSVTTTMEDPDEVWRRNRRYYQERWDFYTRVRSELGDSELTNRAAKSADMDEDPLRPFELIGSPDDILKGLEQICGPLPLTDLTIFAPAAGIPIDPEGLENLRLFAREVLPVVKTW